MNIKELNNYLQSLPEEIISDAAEIVAETATEYYKSAFKKKAFDGNPWTPAKAPKTYTRATMVGTTSCESVTAS